MTASTTLRVVVFQDNGKWIAQGLEYDIAAQADDIGELQTRFHLVLRADLEESLRRSDIPFDGIDAAPERFWKMWERCTERLDPVSASDGGPICEMALCA